VIRLIFLVDWLKLVTWVVVISVGIGFWSLLAGCAMSMGGVVVSPAEYCPHDIDSDTLLSMQKATPVYSIGWNALQNASVSRRSTYGFQQGNAIWVYDDLRDPKETLYHEYCHIYEYFYNTEQPSFPHEKWHSAIPNNYKATFSRVNLELVQYQDKE
jgi:hypothetical protein